MEKFMPRKTEKEVISIRIKSSVLAEVDAVAQETDISRNELLNQCIEFALRNMGKEN